MYSIINWFKNSTLRKNLYRIILVFIVCYLLVRTYKRLEGNKEDKVVIIDVRTKTEWNISHLPDAIHLPVDHIEEYNGDKNTKIIVYCASGRRASEAKQKLEEMGYKSVKIGECIDTPS